MTARKPTPVLIALSGLPGVGKTTVARQVSAEIGAVHVRIDTIEAAMTRSGIVDRAGGWDAVPEAGYRIAYAMASDFLRAGHDVVADSVNPLGITRQAWAEVARTARAALIEVEVICSDSNMHRSRVEARASDIEGLRVPTWQQVQDRAYERWDRAVLRVDTAAGVDPAAAAIVAAFQARM
ncbi:AAA family ATPase [Mycolicibacterium farcinogenes]|uniref:AAA family ATPase n=1 Tax=Mycolicibacterium farcinogenes TaxID=1802 RepID=A0ACD1FLA8_MYCFR|nr:AAA family ATPase [Mycolicibacterium farcinogenes]QZH67766.1 AAA family ATPase [Mycolicibacterium farcinogenes]